MANIAPLKLDEVQDPELRELIARCQALGVPDEQLPLILARVPAYAKAGLRALLMSHTQGNIDHRLKEIIRVQLARFAGDPYFSRLRSRPARESGLDESTIAAGHGDYDEDERFTPAERLALRYAEFMYLDPNRLDKAFYDELKQHYSEAQVMELGAFIAFHYGMQCFARTLDLTVPIPAPAAALSAK
jgi:alkylhydroperoxidase family enzyme